MSSKPHTDVVYVSKRKPKNPIHFQITLNEEQKTAKSKILDSTITVLTGGAGSGKTLLACQIALDLLFNKEIEKIVIARPVITSGEELGFLPGDIKEKMDPFMAPIYENMHRLYSKEKIEKYVSDGLLKLYHLLLCVVEIYQML
jgi:phosphate starvation-inducible protein PhoH and related proteins